MLFKLVKFIDVSTNVPVFINAAEVRVVSFYMGNQTTIEFDKSHSVTVQGDMDTVYKTLCG